MNDRQLPHLIDTAAAQVAYANWNRQLGGITLYAADGALIREIFGTWFVERNQAWAQIQNWKPVYRNKWNEIYINPALPFAVRHALEVEFAADAQHDDEHQTACTIQHMAGADWRKAQVNMGATRTEIRNLLWEAAQDAASEQGD